MKGFICLKLEYLAFIKYIFTFLQCFPILLNYHPNKALKIGNYILQGICVSNILNEKNKQVFMVTAVQKTFSNII